MQIEFRKHGLFIVLAAILLIAVGFIAAGSKSSSPVSEVEETAQEEEDQEPQDYFIDSMGQKLSARDTYTQADKGDPEKQFITGWWLDYGLNGRQSWSEAAEWYEKSRQQGNPKAAAMLGYLYHWGLGVPKDRAKAVGLWKEALPGLETGAEQGDPYAMLVLSFLLAQQEVGKQDLKRSAELLKKVADMEDPVGLGSLGLSYLRGDSGVPKNSAVGMRLLEKAGDLGNAVASAALGDIYREGRYGQPKDDAKAAEWYKKAADRWNDNSLEWLCYMYLEGKGVSQDIDEALSWYSKVLDSKGDVSGFPRGDIKFSKLPEYNKYEQLKYIIRFINDHPQIDRLDNTELFDKPSWQMIWSMALGSYPYAVTFTGYFENQEKVTRKITILFTVYPKQGTQILETWHLFDGDSDLTPGLPAWVERELED